MPESSDLLPFRLEKKEPVSFTEFDPPLRSRPHLYKTRKRRTRQERYEISQFGSGGFDRRYVDEAGDAAEKPNILFIFADDQCL